MEAGKREREGMGEEEGMLELSQKRDFNQHERQIVGATALS